MRAYGHRCKLRRHRLAAALGRGDAGRGVHSPQRLGGSRVGWAASREAVTASEVAGPVSAGHAAMIDPRVDVAGWLNEWVVD